jgi:hypothetical protein
MKEIKKRIKKKEERIHFDNMGVQYMWKSQLRPVSPA